MSITDTFLGLAAKASNAWGRAMRTVGTSVHENDIFNLVEQRKLAEAAINPYTSGDIVVYLPEKEIPAVVAVIDAQLRELGVAAPECYDVPRNENV